MITIPEVVENIVKNSFFFEEGLTLGVINLSSLARKLRLKIEKQTLKKASEGAILMALKRLSTKLKSKDYHRNLFRNVPEMILRSNLMEFCFANSSSLTKKHKQLFNLVHQSNHYFLTITQGVFETGIIISQKAKNLVKKIFNEEKIIKIVEDLSAITIKLPKNNISTPGVYYFILKALAWEKINIIEVISTYCELTIILEDKNVDKAFSILKTALSPKNTTEC
jgi:aspartokinase